MAVPGAGGGWSHRRQPAKKARVLAAGDMFGSPELRRRPGLDSSVVSRSTFELGSRELNPGDLEAGGAGVPRWNGGRAGWVWPDLGFYPGGLSAPCLGKLRSGGGAGGPELRPSRGPELCHTNARCCPARGPSPAAQRGMSGKR